MTVKLITFKTNHTILGEVKDMPENDYVEVKEAVMKDGVLTVKLEREIPEAMKPKKITVQYQG